MTKGYGTWFEVKSFKQAMNDGWPDPKSRRTRARISGRITLVRMRLLKERGKPQAWGDTLSLQSHGREFASVTADDMATIDTRACSWVRFEEAFNLIGVTVNRREYLVPREYYSDRHRNIELKAKWPHMKPVMRFNLRTRTFIDAQFDAQYDTGERDAEWRAAVIRAGRQLRVYARIGGLEKTVAECREIIRAEMHEAGALSKHFVRVPTITPTTFYQPPEVVRQALVDAVWAADPHAIVWALARRPLYNTIQGQILTVDYLIKMFNSYYNKHRTAIRALVGALKERTNDGHSSTVPAETNGGDTECSA